MATGRSRATVRLRLDSGGIAQVLRSPPVAAAVTALGDAVADAARAQGRTVRSGGPLPVTTRSGTTDRAIVTVALAHPAGVGMEAKHGVLTRAAAACGLSVRGGS